MAAILEFKKPGAQDPHATGHAFCLGCDHTWEAVAPVGTQRLECPECHRRMGMFTFEFAPPEGTLVRTCDCGNQLFTLTEEGHMCPRCGTYQSY